MEVVLPSLDYIAGLTAGCGSFMITNQGVRKVHVFQLKLQVEDKQTLEAIRTRLGLDEVVYEYNHQNRHYALLIVRSKITILKNIIPVMDERLFGTKKVQYDNWKESFYQSVLNSKYQKYLVNLL